MVVVVSRPDVLHTIPVIPMSPTLDSESLGGFCFVLLASLNLVFQYNVPGRSLKVT